MGRRRRSRQGAAVEQEARLGPCSCTCNHFPASWRESNIFCLASTRFSHHHVSRVGRAKRALFFPSFVQLQSHSPSSKKASHISPKNSRPTTSQRPSQLWKRPVLAKERPRLSRLQRECSVGRLLLGLAGLRVCVCWLYVCVSVLYCRMCCCKLRC